MRFAIASILTVMAAVAIVVLARSSGSVVAGAKTSASDAERHFALKVLPIFKDKCFGCHGDDPKTLRGGFDMRTLQAIVKGGDSEKPGLVAGKPADSPIFQAIQWKGLKMPPKVTDRLSTPQIELIRTWIADGAPWPNDKALAKYQKEGWSEPENKDGVIVKTSGGLSDVWTNRRYAPADLWAFRPISTAKPPAPNVHPIDAFLQKKLTAAGMTLAPEADKLTLIRRATFDLIGLPPTPAEVEAFLKDSSPKAWDNLIDRLLASPHYGERWAQHWLDVARYADTGGMANDFERSNMWRYRDYVVRSFNDDKPYDRFILEQLAGDQLADASVLQRFKGDVTKVAGIRASGEYTEEEAEWIVASSFLRLGPWDNAMILQPQARQIYLDDLVNAVGQTFLATTMRCFKCHDHKFDPHPTRDYYRLYAAFAGTQMAERPLHFLKTESNAGFAEGKAHVEKMLAFARSEKKRLEAKSEAAAIMWYADHGLSFKAPAARQGDADDKKPPRHAGLDHVDAGQLKVREQDEWIWQRAIERFEPMINAVYDGPDPGLAWNAGRKLRMPAKINTAWKPDSRILLGGALEAPGDNVQPGVLSAVGVAVDGAKSEPYVLPEGITGRRLALAKWVANPRNTLTTRAIVNRVWQYHFGKPIAGTPNNFGAKGAKPTHPELLDWLSADFVEHRWTFKRLHKLIMTSQAYRMGGRHPQIEKLRTMDPNNELLAFFPPRRLSAEELRDAMLGVSGELNPAPGGLPVMPEMNLEVAFQPRMIQFSLAPSYQPSRTPAERNRRSIYAYRGRGLADPFLEAFNQPNPNESCDLRDTAAVSPQAFMLLNSDLVSDRSIALALRLEKEVKGLDAQIQRAFQLVLGRAPSAAETKRLTTYVQKMQTYHRATKPAAVKYPTRITRSLVEELSGKEFEYQEILPVFENYVADTKPADVGPETRALADLCLMLFNSNEFVYLY